MQSRILASLYSSMNLVERRNNADEKKKKFKKKNFHLVSLRAA